MRCGNIRVKGHDRRVVRDVVVLLDAVDQALDGQIRTVCLQLFQNLGHKACPVLNALSAVLVFARIVEP